MNNTRGYIIAESEPMPVSAYTVTELTLCKLYPELFAGPGVQPGRMAITRGEFIALTGHEPESE